MKRSNWIIPLLLIATVGAVAISCKTHFETTTSSKQTIRSAEAVERGRILVYSICAGCHYNQKAGKFIGNRIEDVPGIAGKVYSANLTHSQTNGRTVKYTDEQLKYLLKTGVAYDGRFIGYMLRPNMAESDLDAIVAFLRSDDPALAAADTTIGPTHYNLIGKMYMGMHSAPLPYVKDVKRPGENETLALGKYLVDNLGCFHCHSKSLTSINYLQPEQSPGFMAGGTKMVGEKGAKVTASNITFDKTTGIGDYTRAQFIRAVKDGEAPQRKLVPPMPKFRLLSDAEVGAIYDYLKMISPVSHKIKLE